MWSCFTSPFLLFYSDTSRAVVNVTLTSERYDDVIEGNTIDVEILANGTVPDGMLSVILYQGESIVRGEWKMLNWLEVILFILSSM